MSEAISLSEIYCSPEEYLASERVSETKHEYLNGVIYAMAGASLAHNYLASNILIRLGMQLLGQKCAIFGSDRRLRIRQPGASFYYYPDVTVDCSGSSEDECDEPTVLFEILSPSSDRADRGDKIFNYQQLPSLRVYVLIDQFRPVATVYRRDAEGEWKTEYVTGLAATLTLPEIDCALPMAEVYERVF